MMKIFKKAKEFYRKKIAALYYRFIMGKFGGNSLLVRPTAIDGAENIYIGENVIIAYGAWLAAVPHTGKVNCKLVIGNNTYIGRYGHIYAVSRISIGNKVLIADKVYISDNSHTYTNTKIPVIDQPVIELKSVEIKDGAWLGENVCIVGSSVGYNSVVAANSVVLRDIPDYCVAAGAPAVVIKRYNNETGQWQKTTPDGEFI